jgi:site-specific recombinase XerD/predicted DNA-binding transcriptional regulator AlpA
MEVTQIIQTAATFPLLISVESVAELLGISPRSVWRRLSSGEMIEPIKIGKSVRWRRQEVIDWVEAGCPIPVIERKGK